MSKKKLPSSAVAARYNRSLKTVDRWVELGILPEPEYINGLKYWNEQELDAADQARKQGARRAPTNVGARSKKIIDTAPPSQPQGNAVDPEASADMVDANWRGIGDAASAVVGKVVRE
jgi:hypothetical protein